MLGARGSAVVHLGQVEAARERLHVRGRRPLLQRLGEGHAPPVEPHHLQRQVLVFRRMVVGSAGGRSKWLNMAREGDLILECRTFRSRTFSVRSDSAWRRGISAGSERECSCCEPGRHGASGARIFVDADRSKVRGLDTRYDCRWRGAARPWEVGREGTLTPRSSDVSSRYSSAGLPPNPNPLLPLGLHSSNSALKRALSFT